jgi:hypothetical protein
MSHEQSRLVQEGIRPSQACPEQSRVSQGLPDRYEAGQDALSRPCLAEEEDHTVLSVTTDLSRVSRSSQGAGGASCSLGLSMIQEYRLKSIREIVTACTATQLLAPCC